MRVLARQQVDEPCLFFLEHCLIASSTTICWLCVVAAEGQYCLLAASILLGGM
jgi:hypothetical protein